jgi:sugar O-acyltransferase (sialic acid O-acetyltransferase NeuD family)
MSATRRLVIFGTGSMGTFAAAHFNHEGDWQIAAFTAHRKFITGDSVQGVPLVPFETLVETHPPGEFAVFVALSYARMNRVRRNAFLEVKARGYHCASYVSKHARSLEPVVHGENVFINESVFQPNARVGHDVLIMSNNVIAHDVVIGDHSFISSGVVISGNVTVGERCFFGVNSCCRENITIAEGTLAGAGVTLLRSTKPNTAYIAPTPTAMALEADGEDFLVRPKFGSDPSA